MTSTVRIPKLGRQIELRAQSADDEARTVEVVWTTGATVLRKHWERGTYNEALDVSAEAVMLDRLNGGAPVLNAHSDLRVEDILGVVVPGSARIENGLGVATIQISPRSDADGVWQDIKAGILRKVSVGYRVHVFEIDETQQPPLYTARSWEPYEISMVPIPADDGASVRSDSVETNDCALRAKPVTPEKETVMSQDIETKGAAQVAPTPAPAAPVQTAPDLDAIRKEAAAAERTRASEIQTLGRKLKLDDEFVTTTVSSGVSLDGARAAFIDKVAERSETEGSTRAQFAPGGDEVEKRRAVVESALAHRLSPKAELIDGAREYRGMSAMEIGKSLLEARGVSVRGKNRSEVAAMILSRAHSTSDFPFILANVANKTLRQSYTAAPQTFRPIVRETFNADFKPVSRTQLGEAPALSLKPEGAEITYGTVNESREQYALATYARGLRFTREMLINDDLSAFDRLVSSFGRAAANLESDLVWAIITGNPNMADGTALFHADHGNLASASVINVAGLGAAKVLMRKQTALDGKTLLNLTPRFLAVPAELETLALQYTSSAFQPETSANINVHGPMLTPIIEPRLFVSGVAATDGTWFLFADPAEIDTIEIAYLEGEAGPVIEQEDDFNTDAVSLKGRLDFAAKAIDFRGMVKVPKP